MLFNLNKTISLAKLQIITSLAGSHSANDWTLAAPSDCHSLYWCWYSHRFEWIESLCNNKPYNLRYKNKTRLMKTDINTRIVWTNRMDLLLFISVWINNLQFSPNCKLFILPRCFMFVSCKIRTGSANCCTHKHCAMQTYL